jgi:VWFA-related protein
MRLKGKRVGQPRCRHRHNELTHSWKCQLWATCLRDSEEFIWLDPGFGVKSVFMKRWPFTAAVSLCILFTQASIPQNPPAPGPRFRSQTNLVLIPVQVRSHGQHVPNLKQEAFTILQDGKPQKVAIFEEVRTSTQRLQRVPVGPREFTNQVIGNPETARYTVIAIDRMNTAPLDLMRVREGLIKFLAHTVDTGEPIRLISIESNGLLMLQDFTTDPKAIGAALNRALSRSAPKPEQSSVGLDEFTQEADVAMNMTKDPAGLSQLLDALDRTKDNENRMLAFQERSARISSLDALQQIALSLAGIPGRKSLVWASSGYPFSSIVKQSRGQVQYDFSQVSEALSLDAYTTRLLSNSNIAMYPVDARGMTNTEWDSMDPAHKFSATKGEQAGRRQANGDVITTFERLAAGTGGRPCYNRAELSDCFKEALDDSRNYYMVGFYVDRNSTKDGWHKLQVKVDEKGSNVRSRNGFLFPLPDPDKNRAQDMSTAVHSLLLDSGIPFKGEWTTTKNKGDKVANGFVIQLPSEANVIDPDQNKLDLEIVGIARAKDGTIAGRFAQKVQRSLTPEAIAMIQKTGVSYTNTIDLPLGVYLVRMVVHDNNTGRTGAVNTLLKVQ